MTPDLAANTDGGDHRRGARAVRVARRTEKLRTVDAQFGEVWPDESVVRSVRSQNLRLTEVFELLVENYADRPALGTRARELVRNSATGRTTTRLLPSFDTISYSEMWSRVRAIAAALRHDRRHPVGPGDIVVTIGFASADYLMVEFVCAYLGLVAVPLQHTTNAERLKPIIDEIEPRVVAVGANYLDLAVESTGDCPSLRHLIAFDHRAEDDDARELFEATRTRLRARRTPVRLHALDEVAEFGASLPDEPPHTDSPDSRLALILYTSGTTGSPKGAMYTEAMLTKLWTSSLTAADTPIINVNFQPLNHGAGRLPLIAAFQAGGTSYFASNPDLSTLFDDWALVRPTQLALVPRVVDMLFQRFASVVDRELCNGAELVEAERRAAAELTERVLGGRVLTGFVGTAPLASEMKDFLDSVLDVHVIDCYGTTETGLITKDEAVMRPPVIDYQLVDVPELGYFRTDRPHPRGELLIKSASATPGYYKRPSMTATVFDEDGYYRTGDVVAEIEPDRLMIVDRRSNVIKLSQGEFVAVAHLEAVFARAPLIRQIYLYGNSERARLLAVVVPTPEGLESFGDTPELKSKLLESLHRTATTAQLQSYEVPVEILVETEPFSTTNDLVSSAGKLARPNLKERYSGRLEQVYLDIAAAQVARIRVLKDAAPRRPAIHTLTLAAQVILGATEVDTDVPFTELGGDSLSALTLSNLLQEIFGIAVSVGEIINPAGDLRHLARLIEFQRDRDAAPVTAETVHGEGATRLRAADLTLEKFIDPPTLAAAPSLPRAVEEPATILLTGANGWLGRFLALELMQQASDRGGKLIAIIRAHSRDEATARLEAAFDSGDEQLLRRFQELATDSLEVVPGDIGEPYLGLHSVTWCRLTRCVDAIVHAAALVNHVLPYRQLFGPNVAGTVELIRLAITARTKPITYLSTIAIARGDARGAFEEERDIRVVSPVRSVDETYANGYSNSKWAGEVLLREAHDLCGLPVAVFRSDMIMAHPRYTGQLNPADMLSRLILSLITTGLAPRSFYASGATDVQPRPHYGGLPVDFIARAVTTIGGGVTDGFRSFNVRNPHDDGVSLDSFVDWLIDTGHRITRIGDYDEWLTRFETALTRLPEARRAQSVLPLLDAYRKQERPHTGCFASARAFQAAVHDAKIDFPDGIPHVSPALIAKYGTDLRGCGLV